VDDGDNVGRVTLLLRDGSALVCWLSGNTEGCQIKVRRIQADGTVGPVAVIGQTDISRSSGFPRMARFGDRAHARWLTEFDPGEEYLIMISLLVFTLLFSVLKF
jgi:hypothetical protein